MSDLSPSWRVVNITAHYETMCFANIQRPNNSQKQNTMAKVSVRSWRVGLSVGPAIFSSQHESVEMPRASRKANELQLQMEKPSIQLERPHGPLCGQTFVAMMQSDDFADFNDPASL